MHLQYSLYYILVLHETSQNESTSTDSTKLECGVDYEKNGSEYIHNDERLDGLPEGEIQELVLLYGTALLIAPFLYIFFLDPLTK